DITINVPAGTQPGDVLLAAISHTAYEGMPLIDGWTMVNNSTNVVGISTYVFSRTAEDDEPASYTWTSTFNSTKIGCIVALANARNIEGSSHNSNVGATDLTNLSVMPDDAGRMIVAVWGATP